MDTTIKLAKAAALQTKQQYELQFTTDSPGNFFGRPIVPGYVPNTGALNYHETIKVCRWFYAYDPIAGTVIERMADMSITALKNRKRSKKNNGAVDDTTFAFYDAVAEKITPLLKLMALEFLIHGMAIPDYVLGKVRGDLLSEKLGRKRYLVPESMWCRNPENIILKKQPAGMERAVFFRIPAEDIAFVMNGGIYSDGLKDPEYYQYLLDNFPEYVKLIKSGKTIILLEDIVPVLRKINSYDAYPTPYLQKAIKALQHKEFLKTMDRSIANRAIEAIRHIKTGDKDFPADDEDIKATKDIMAQNNSNGERVFNLFTNHTVTIEWNFPPLDALLNEAKYAEPNADIFLGLGFPRIFVSGETLRSNSSDSRIAALGPKATMDDLRAAILIWIKSLYQVLAEKNGLSNIPEPYFAPIPTTDVTALIQFAEKALGIGAISKDTVAQLWNTDYATEAEQIEYEIELAIPTPTERAVDTAFKNQQKVMKQTQDFQKEQMALAPDTPSKPAAKPTTKAKPVNKPVNKPTTKKAKSDAYIEMDEE